MRVNCFPNRATFVISFFDALGVADGGARGPFAPKPTIGARQQFLLMPYLLSGDPAANEARMAEEFPDDYASWKKKYDKNRITATRTDYEVDFIDAVARVARLGVNYNPDLYSS
ncbi:hypothetical protein CYMTET_36965 [Cymbomonas tetramitiformis]|uniref:Uncharacterized protein n=1 Tax=Cymbomonas tetramitiformis TaxID=36881 RepID=A0AAE0CEY0_9CHLO|nr:hypothetical protein CYMTET_36965 [Cymbomonas tetramitiformis]